MPNYCTHCGGAMIFMHGERYQDPPVATYQCSRCNRTIEVEIYSERDSHDDQDFSSMRRPAMLDHQCVHCIVGQVTYSHLEFDGHQLIAVYKCDHCRHVENHVNYSDHGQPAQRRLPIEGEGDQP